MDESKTVVSAINDRMQNLQRILQYIPVELRGLPDYEDMGSAPMPPRRRTINETPTRVHSRPVGHSSSSAPIPNLFSSLLGRNATPPPNYPPVVPPKNRSSTSAQVPPYTAPTITGEHVDNYVASMPERTNSAGSGAKAGPNPNPNPTSNPMPTPEPTRGGMTMSVSAPPTLGRGGNLGIAKQRNNNAKGGSSDRKSHAVVAEERVASSDSSSKLSDSKGPRKKDNPNPNPIDSDDGPINATQNTHNTPDIKRSTPPPSGAERGTPCLTPADSPDPPSGDADSEATETGSGFANEKKKGLLPASVKQLLLQEQPTTGEGGGG
eukprot:CAMPEP_0184489358 /NCGR_PEP_ID=MMETSP0113_2-20130426/15155_1 /TAXON_ID=91329 /ORGANISM="Norrisiella sphaerica, Strain BC52" /LENGTH=321 /DNA_ID=CAMNT_0026872719 /DNA_START=279 /DNA_END=1240 /DNA_ORIENTATION=+